MRVAVAALLLLLLLPEWWLPQVRMRRGVVRIRAPPQRPPTQRSSATFLPSTTQAASAKEARLAAVLPSALRDYR